MGMKPSRRWLERPKAAGRVFAQLRYLAVMQTRHILQTRADLIALLDRLGLAHDTIQHPAVFRDREGQLDKTLAEAGRVNFHPLTNTATTGVSRDGFRAFLAAVGVTPMVVDFAQMAVVEADAR